jgi:hypothetical protein
MNDNIYELLNSSSFSEEEFDNIETDLTDLEVKQLKNNFRKNVKTFNKKKLMYIAASLAIFITVGTFTVKPAFAQSFIESIPVIDSLYEKLGYYKEFKDLSSYVGLSQEKDGYKFTIDKLMADDENVMVAMRIYKSGLTTKKDENGKVNDFMIFPLITKDSNIFMSSDNNSQILDDNTLLIVTKLNSSTSKKIPKRFDMDLIVRTANTSDILAKFKIPVSRESTDKETIIKNNVGKITLGKIDTIKIDRLKASSLGSSIKFSLEKGGESPIPNFKFYLSDDKGRIYTSNTARADDSGYYIFDFTRIEKDAKQVNISAALTSICDTAGNINKTNKLPEEFNFPYGLNTLKTFSLDGIGSVKINNIEKKPNNIKFHFQLDDAKNLLKYHIPINLGEKNGDEFEHYIPLEDTSFYKDVTSVNQNDYIIEFKNLDPTKTYYYNASFPYYNTLAQGGPLKVNLK